MTRKGCVTECEVEEVHEPGGRVGVSVQEVTGSIKKEAGKSANKIYIFRRPFLMWQRRCVWATVDTGHHLAASVFSEAWVEEGRRRKVDMSGCDIMLIGYADGLNVMEKGKRDIKGK